MNPVSQANQAVDFHDIQAATPSLEEVAAQYDELHAAWEKAANPNARLTVFLKWDTLRRKLETWAALVKLRFDQDTRDPASKAAREHCDALLPKLTALEIGMKRRLLASRHRGDLEARIGKHAFLLWDADVAAFSPAIEADLTHEAQLEAKYTGLIAAAQLEIDGKRVNLAGIEPYTQSPDREMRHRAQQVRWGFFEKHGSELDEIYDELVQLRHSMARKLGYQDFTGLAYKRMHRIDYDQADAERYREQVARDIVPVASHIIAGRAEKLGLAEITFWDESVSSPAGNPAPQGDDDWVVQRGHETFAVMHPNLGQFYEMMVQRGLVDLKNREGKAAGGYCTAFPNYGVPYIFASFNGTHGDVHVLVHEMGHAFQAWQSRSLPVIDYLWPTSESAEIHSMSIEFLAAPFIERFFGKDSERYRRQQLEDSMLFLPYGVAVDHFQHMIYADPEASPAQRHRMWSELEARYLPWRRYGDLAYLAKGGLWQAKEHIYRAPFYYIDYTLAMCCALQFWVRSREDYARAVADYIALCKRGGEAAFRALTRSAHLLSPFDEGALAQVAFEARRALE